MARIARIVVPGLPHHVTQRGNRREQVFFELTKRYRQAEFIVKNASAMKRLL